MLVLQLNPKILINRGKYKCKCYKFTWKINLKRNTHMQGHLKITHVGSLNTQCSKARMFSAAPAKLPKGLMSSKAPQL